jgi:urea transporter
MLAQKFPFVIILLRGLGQIMLQENAATGLFFLIGIFYGSTTMGIAAILSVCCGTLTAKILAYDKSEIEKGLYGFSAALVGVALPLYFEPVFMVWLSIILGSVAATLLQHFFITKKIAVFTLPFVLVTWLILFLFENVYPLAPSALLDATPLVSPDFTFALRGFGQVIFQGSLFAGILFCIGVYINSPISALYGIAGAVLAAILSAWFSAPIASVAMGLFSYNAVLCAIVFAGDKIKDGLWVFLSVVLSVFISLIMHQYQLTPLTFPFVAGSCITLLLKNSVLFISKKLKL